MTTNRTGTFVRALLLGAALLTAPAAHAQACVGLPAGGRGQLTYGFEGTDGATGEGLGFAYHTPRAALLVHRRSLEAFTLVDEVRSLDTQGSVPVLRTAVPVCLTLGAGWTGYDNERLESRSSSGRDPGFVTERHRVGGPYRRFRFPVGIAAGREFRPGTGVSLTPFVAPSLVYETESYRPENGTPQERSRLGAGASGGLTLAAGWLVVRSTVSHTATHDRALTGRNNFPTLSVHAGVRF
jgi:hypothetical protein